MTASIQDTKPQLVRAPASASSSSLASSTRNISRSPTRCADGSQSSSCWGYVYGSATFAKSKENMSQREQAFSAQVETNLRAAFLPSIREDEHQGLSVREKTIRAQLAQWRAEDQALARSAQDTWTPQ